MTDAEIDAVVAFLGTLTDAPFMPSSSRAAVAQLPTAVR